MNKIKPISIVVLLFSICFSICMLNDNVHHNLIEVTKYKESNMTSEYDNKSFDIIWSTDSLGTRKTVVHYYDITNNKEIDGSANWIFQAIDGQKITLSHQKALTPENELKYKYIGAKIDSIDGEGAEEISFSAGENGWYYYPTTDGDRKTWKTKDVLEVHVYLLYEQQEQTNDLELLKTEDTSRTINIMAFDYSFKYHYGYTHGINTSNGKQRPFLVAGTGEAEEWFNKWSGYWTEDMINSHTTSYNNNREFLVQNIVSRKLVDGHPVLSAETDNEGESLSYLFNEESVEGKIVYGGNSTKETLNHFFIKDEDGYYSYNSDENFASLVSTRSNDNDFTVYKVPSSQKNKAKFMPFNDLDNNEELIGKGAHGVEDDYYQYYSGYTEGIGNGNFVFGIKMEFDFTQPKDGKDQNNNDVTFEIGADDCVWVFIDDVLILDLGGVHGTEKTTINFATGEITEGILKSTLAEKINAAKADIKLDSNGLYLENSKHHIKIYSLERGGYESIFKIKFNLQLVEQNLYNTETKTDGNGEVSISQDKAAEGEKIEIVVTPKEGYTLSVIKVIDENGNLIEVSNNSFIMPASDVQIEVIFEKNSSQDNITNPNTVGTLLGIVFIGFGLSILISSKYYKKIKH